MLTIGDPAPHFSLPDQDGQIVTLTDYQGKKNLVVYFYPTDDTPGCTLEAQSFSRSRSDFEQQNTVILGISKDSQADHRRFCHKYNLTIRLLSDPTHEVIDRYGVWQKKQFMGKEHMGTVRSTFLIDKEGVIQYCWIGVSPEGHDQEVLAKIEELGLDE